MSKNHYPPGPKGGLVRGSVPQFLADPLNFLEAAASQYGDIVSMRFLNRRVYVLNHPDYIKHVLVDNNQNYKKGRALGATRPVIGDGLLTSEGEFHLRQRRLIQPAFHRRQIAAFAETMTQFTQEHSASWQNGQQLDLHQELMQLTMRIVTQTLFSVDLAQENKALAAVLDQLMTEFDLFDATPIGQWLYKLPLPQRRRREMMLHILDEAVYGFIKAGREQGGQSDDLLSMLLMAQDDAGDGDSMTDKQVRDEVMTLFIAGHETTANAIAWTFYLLTQHPAVEAKLRAELDTMLMGRTASMADVANLKYTQMVFSEAMRLYPPAWIMGRTPITDDEIGGYRIPGGAPVIMSQWVMHRHPAYWDAPDQFRPERFDPADITAKDRPRYSYFPFGGGPRLCIGEPFAHMEGVLLIATLAQKFRFQLAQNAHVEPQPRVTLRLKDGLPVVVEQVSRPATLLNGLGSKVNDHALAVAGAMP